MFDHVQSSACILNDEPTLSHTEISQNVRYLPWSKYTVLDVDADVFQKMVLASVRIMYSLEIALLLWQASSQLAKLREEERKLLEASDSRTSFSELRAPRYSQKS